MSLSLPAIPRRYLVCIVVAAVIALLWWCFLIVPPWRAWAAAHPEARELRQKIRQVRKGMEGKEVLQGKLDALCAELKAVPRALAQEQVPALLDEIAEMAKAHAVTVEAVRPAAAKQSPRAPSKASARQKEKETEFLLVPIEILCNAGYHDVGRFLDALEGASSLYRVRTLVIEADHRSAERHSVRLVVQAYLAVVPL